MPDQFDVHRKPGARNPAMPYVVVIQSNRFRASSQRVVVPLMDALRFKVADGDVAPHFLVEGRDVVLDSLRITNAPVRELGEAVASLAEHDARIVNALDTVLSRAWQ